MGAIVTVVCVRSGRWDSRSAGPPSAKALLTTPPPAFIQAESAALFVGVRKFTHGETVEVPYAVDDAVDLAFMFVLDPRLRLVPPGRVVLALSGKPVKLESQQRLRDLQEAGARIEAATQSDIVDLLDRQASAAGPNGIFIVAIATHGFTTTDGEPYILGASSVVRYPDTALSASRIFDITSQSQARRSLVFIDACRDRIESSRAGVPDPMTAAPNLRRMKNIAGQVVFYAAASGHYAYDDPVSRNGVFTKAVLDGLSCGATPMHGVITAASLQKFVEKRVKSWLRQNRKPLVEPATQISYEGDADKMPLSQCTAREPLPPIGNPVRAAILGSFVTAYDKRTTPLWHYIPRGPVVDVKIADLEADGANEVVIGLRGDRAQAGSIAALGRDKTDLWTADSGAGIPMNLEALRIGPIFFGDKADRIVALWSDPLSSSSRITIHGAGGKLEAAYTHPTPLNHIEIDRPTTRHALKIIATSADALFLFDPKKLAAPVWSRRLASPGNTIKKLRVADSDNDARRDIAITTTRGTSRFDFSGNPLGTGQADAQWEKIAPTKIRRPKAAPAP